MLGHWDMRDMSQGSELPESRNWRPLSSDRRALALGIGGKEALVAVEIEDRLEATDHVKWGRAPWRGVLIPERCGGNSRAARWTPRPLPAGTISCCASTTSCLPNVVWPIEH